MVIPESKKKPSYAQERTIVFNLSGKFRTLGYLIHEESMTLSYKSRMQMMIDGFLIKVKDIVPIELLGGPCPCPINSLSLMVI